MYIYPLRRASLSLSHVLRVAGAAGAVWAASCGSPSHSATAGASAVSFVGTVRSVAGAPVAGARVAPPNDANSSYATTDAAGHYALAMSAADLASHGLAATAEGYAPASRWVPGDATEVDFSLRAYDTVTQVMLPSAVGAVATATAQRGDGAVTLTLGAADLLTAAGAVAQGAAEVRLTYWNPATDLAERPASMAAYLPGNGNGALLLSLQSLGMVDVQVLQNDQPLQVAPGHTLGLDQVLPAQFKAAMSQRPNDWHAPFLFFQDGNTGAWVLDGNLTYDAAAGALRGQLPHLTTWNYDDFENWNPPASCTTDDILNGRGSCGKPQNSVLGGCMTGLALGADKAPLANQTVRVYLFDFEHTSAIDVPTDGSGRYCVDVGTRLCVPYGNSPECHYTSNTISYHVSSPSSPEQSSMADPLPAQCRSQSATYSYATYKNVVQYFNDCAIVNDDATSQTGSVAALVAPAQAQTQACTYCNGSGPGYCNVAGASLSGACAALPTVTIPLVGGAAPSLPAGCASTLGLGSACSAATAACCATGTSCLGGFCCAKALRQGDVCAGAAGCCAAGTSCNGNVCCSMIIAKGGQCAGLAHGCCEAGTTCLDDLCVPPQD